MSFCSSLQHHLHSHHPQWTWRVVENQNPSTSVLILAQGQTIPGEVVVSVFDSENQKVAESVVGGQAYCNFIKVGRTDADFAADLGRKILAGVQLG